MRTGVGEIRFLGGLASGLILWFAAIDANYGAGQLAGLIVFAAWGLGCWIGAKGAVILSLFIRRRWPSGPPGPSWSRAFWGGNLAVCLTCYILVPPARWPWLLLALGCAVQLCYAAARIGCLLNGCCWQQTSGPLLRRVLQLTGGPLPRAEAVLALVLVLAALPAAAILGCIGLIGTILLSLHGWLRFSADGYRRRQPSQSWLIRSRFALEVQIWALLLLSVTRIR